MNEDKITSKLDNLQQQYNKNIPSYEIKLYEEFLTNDDITNEYLKLKSFLKNIINNNGDIQTIANYFNTQDIIKINKKWDDIYKSYIKLHGVYNPIITNKKIIAFLKDKIGR